MPEKVPTGRPEHLSELSPEYEGHKERLAEIAPQWDKSFGESTIEYIDSLRDDLAAIEAKLAQFGNLPEAVELLNQKRLEYSEAIEKSIVALEADLTKRFDSEPFGGPMGFFMEVGDHPKTPEILADKLASFSEKTVGLMFLFRAKQISPKEFEEIVRQYVRAHAEKRDEFNERLPEILADFRDAATRAIEAGYLPISKEHLEARMSETRFYLSDTMENQLDVGGTYYPRLHAAKIAICDDLEDECHAVYHEMVHALAGRTILMRDRSGDMVTNIESQREGLAFNVYDKDGNRVDERFRWLNEAITEEIAARLHGINKQAYEEIYKEERAMVAKLHGDGLSQESLYNAYFENYEPHAEQKVPAWKRLTQQISETYDRGGIEVLNKFENVDKWSQRKKDIERQLMVLEAKRGKDRSGS